MRTVAEGQYEYRVQYLLPGRPSRTTTFQSDTPLEAGQWLTVDGI